jgi:arylsulfatase A-like enzyme
MKGQVLNRRGRAARRFGAFALVAAFIGAGDRATAREDERPNFLLITCEDMGPDLGCFGDETAITPRLDALAAEGVRYTRAFATAPVCSPARTALFFSRYQASLGGSNHRSRPKVGDEIDGFAALLRDAGYFTANGPKLDINADEHRALAARAFDSGGGWWDEARGERPFMVIRNFDTTHQSRTSVWPRERYERDIRAKLTDDEIHDPGDMVVPPYYPDTPAVRAQLARYADCVTLMDRQVGRLLDRLERDGLADDTVVVFFSDHGAGLTGHKKIALARGTRVPMIVRIPDKWAHLATAAHGETDDRLVSFVDIGPTLLHAAGLAIPVGMHGVPFLGGEPQREFAFAARDRIDEDIDHARMVTDGRYVYMRSYAPDRPFWSPNGYASPSAIYRALEEGLASGTLPPEAERYMTEPRGAELLFDLETDPMELRDVSSDPAQSGRLLRFQAALNTHLRETGDLGLVPEAILRRCAGDLPAPALAGRRDLLPLDGVWVMAKFVGLDERMVGQQGAAASHPHEAIRYWAMEGLRCQTAGDESDRLALTGGLADASPTVRIAAATACLARGFEIEYATGVLTEALGSESYWDALLAAREGQMLGVLDDAFIEAVRAAAEKWGRYELGEVARLLERTKKGAAGAAPSVP